MLNFLSNELTNIHPMIIHFPIVLLFVFLFLYMVSVVTKNGIPQWINLVILIGLVAFSLISKLTGEDAGIEVGPNVLNPRAISTHAQAAIYFIRSAVFLFVLFTLIEFFFIKKNIIKQRFIPIFRGLIVVVGIGSCYFLINAGHTGATLVYKYAAGVDIPLRTAEKVIEKHKEQEANKSRSEDHD